MDEIKHEELTLKWENHQRTIVTALGSLLNNGTFTDCTLAAEGQFIEAHRFVLSACSPYFSAIFSQKCDKHPLVVLHGIKLEELRAILDYMYKGEVNVRDDQIPALITAAESLQIKGLTKGRGKSPQADDDRQRQDTDQIEDDKTAGQDNIPLQVNCKNHTQQKDIQLTEQMQKRCSKGIPRSKKSIPSDNGTEYDSFGRPKHKMQLKRKSNVDGTKSPSINPPLKKAAMSRDVHADFETDLSSRRSVRTKSLHIAKTSYASGYVATEFAKNERGKDILICNGFELMKSSSCRQTTYWRCNNYRIGCKASAKTKFINGACMMEIIEPNHNHP